MENASFHYDVIYFTKEAASVRIVTRVRQGENKSALSRDQQRWVSMATEGTLSEKVRRKNVSVMTGSSQRRLLSTGLLFFTRNYGGIKRQENDMRIDDPFVEDVCLFSSRSG
ncbi:hypothetical protein CEXT_549561 [Caerostris extrusa]|uniref:Uncharacterized protein n=1 Tax=Caerostris extrusa TaxID=172846 RepID=A0AAV4N5X7_CAEEX|nr:hypothetical protein CEXT_549561 [Caerostris extrusa]